MWQGGDIEFRNFCINTARVACLCVKSTEIEFKMLFTDSLDENGRG